MQAQSVTMLLCVVLAVTLLVGCAPVQAPAPTAAPQVAAPTAAPAKPKIAFIIANRSDDMGWGTQAYLGISRAAQKHGLEFSLSEEVQLANAEAIMNDYAAGGASLVIAHGFQFVDAMQNVAPKYPNVWFVATSAAGTTGGNIANFTTKVQELGYITGVLAAKMSKTGSIAGFGGFDTPTVVALMEGYRLGAQSINPDIKVSIQYLNTWGDVAKGQEAGKAAIANGADVLFHNASLAGTGMMKAAEEKGVLAIGFPLNQNNQIPGTVIASAIQKYDDVIGSVVDKFMDKSLKGELYMPGMADGVFDMAYSAAVPDDVKAAVDQAKKDIAAGKVTVPEITKPTQ